MITRAGAFHAYPRRPMANGEPGGTIEEMFKGSMLGADGNVFCKVTVLPGASIPKHQHQGEFEVYYLLSGSGVYIDNDDKQQVYPGDAMFCACDEYHGLDNTGEENVVIIAYIGKV